MNMSGGNRSTDSPSWPQADVYIKENPVESLDQTRKIPTQQLSQRLRNVTESWNGIKRKRSRGGGRMPSPTVRQDSIVDTRTFTLTPARDLEAVQDVTGDNQGGMDSLPVLKQQTRLLSNGHIEKFLARNPNPIPKVMTRGIQSTHSEARVPCHTIISRFEDEKTDAGKSAVKLPVNGGLLFKRLLSALIDENQDLDVKTDPTRMQEWEMDFCGPVPDENLLLKELHLIGIYPEILPGLVEKEDDADQGNEKPKDVIYSKLASESPLLPRKRGRPRSKYVKNSITKENEASVDSTPISGTKRKRGRKPKDPLIGKCKKEPTLDTHGTKSEKVVQPMPNVSLQEAKSTSPREGLITEENSVNVPDIIGFSDVPQDLDLTLNLDDLEDYLPQDDDDFSCLDIPMDDISNLNFSGFP